MRQVGARDRARAAGGYGICGRELCCSNWLTTFPAISIRMAKEQDLPLNPQKISGLCGRLLCCLSYEEEGYKEMRKTLPKLGQRCSTPTGEGKVIGINILQRRVTLVVEGQRIEVGDRDLGLVVRWDATSRAGAPPPPLTEEELRALGRFEEPADGSGGDSGPSNWGSPPASRDSGRGRLPAPRPAPRPASERPAAREAPPQRRSQARPPKRQESPSGVDTQTPRRSEPRDAGPPSTPSSPSRTFRRAGPPPASSKAPGIGGANPADGTAAEPSQAGGAPRSRRRGRRHGPRDTGGPPTDLNQSREPNNH